MIVGNQEKNPSETAPKEWIPALVRQGSPQVAGMTRNNSN
jgi:hypothetical protein